MRKAGRDFIGSAVVRKSNVARRCEVAIQRGVITIRRFVAFYVPQNVQCFKNGLRKRLEIAINKNSLAFKALCALKMVM